MADQIDQANERAEQFLAHSLGKAATVRRLTACGQCYNCDEPVEGDKTFCDADCRDDWQLRQPKR
jgi:hypothetical protein